MPAAVLVICAGAAMVLVSACGSSPTAAAATRVDAIFTAWNRPDSPGCAVGVSRNGAVIFERGYGMASLERRVPITTLTVFPLASITKAFTAMSVLLAADRGVLSLDDDVAKYLPDWSTREQRVTIRHLITHTSGLRDAYLLQGWAPHIGNSQDALIRILTRQRGLNSVPGAEYRYNNGGYVLLGRILERASGQTLGGFADANVFTPLGMTGAWFNGDPVRTAPDHASGYSPQPNGWRLLPEGSGYGGNAGMMASVRDLFQWANNFFEPRVGTPELLTRMQTATVLTGGESVPHGMGMGIGSYRGARRFVTSGGDVGTATELDLYPDLETAIAVLCNMDSVAMGGLATVNPGELTNAVADVFLEDALEPRPTGAGSAPASAGSAPPAVILSADELARMTGFYRVGSEENYIVSTSVREGRFVFRDYYGDNYDIPMTPIGAARFLIPGATLEFAPAGAGRSQAWHVIDGSGRRLLELPLMKFEVPAADLPAFAGDYRSDDLDVTYTVTVRDAGLVLQSSRLHPVFQDAFVGDYMGTVRFARDAKGSVTGFTLNRNSARGVRFDRLKRSR
jgi:CubicO group peptidase (beta-lactamase class C family)